MSDERWLSRPGLLLILAAEYVNGWTMLRSVDGSDPECGRGLSPPQPLIHESL